MSRRRANDQAQERKARPCPDDFEIVFVEQGRLECETWYRARRTTVTRWLIECGKARLLKRRAAFVKHQRDLKKGGKGRARSSAAGKARKIDPRLIELAIAHLQRRENGSWVIVPCECGDFITGTRRRTAAELIELAERKGFNRRRALAQIKAFAEAV